jgi:hypothetical protein
MHIMNIHIYIYMYICLQTVEVNAVALGRSLSSAAQHSRTEASMSLGADTYSDSYTDSQGRGDSSASGPTGVDRSRRLGSAPSDEGAEDNKGLRSLTGRWPYPCRV